VSSPAVPAAPAASSAADPPGGPPLRAWAAGALVVALALALRLALLHTARFGGDEALFFRIGMDIVEGKAFPLLGTQITDGKGLLPGPAFLYLMALPLLVVRAPEAQYAFVEILGAVTVGVYWHAMRRPFGEVGALFAGTLMALSPWSALYADRTWNPNVLPLIVALALLAAIRLREDPRSSWLIALLPLAAVMPHFHMSAPVAWAGLFLLVASTMRRWDRRRLAAGLALALLLYVPLLVHEVQTGLGNIRNILAETLGGGGGARHPTSFLWVPVYALRFLTLDVTYHELTGYWGGPDEVACLKATFSGTPPRPFHPLRLFAFVTSLMLALGALVVSVHAAHRAWRRAKRPPVFGLAFGAALVVNMALLGVAGKQVFGHYVTNLFPFAFVAYAALGRAAFAERTARSRTVPAMVLAAALVFAVGGIEATLSISRRVDARIGLEVHRRALAQIRDDALAEGLEGESVRLDFGFRSSLYDWHIFATRAMGMRIHFDRRAQKRVYRLVEKRAGHAPPPAARGEPVDVGHALLYRLR
jgi:hypothetical protein